MNRILETSLYGQNPSYQRVPDNVKEIWSDDGFENKVGTVITLEPNTEYHINRSFTTACTFVIPTGSINTFKFGAFNLTEITCSTTGTLFSGVNITAMQFFDAAFVFTSTGKMWDTSGDGAALSQVSFVQSRIGGCTDLGTLASSRFFMTGSAFIDCDGLTLTNIIDGRIVESIWLNFTDTSADLITIDGTNDIIFDCSTLTSTTTASQILFNVSNLIGVGSRIKLIDNSFIGAGIVFNTSGIEQTDIRVIADANTSTDPLYADSRSIGAYIAQGVDIATVISAQGAGETGYVDLDLDEQTGSITVFATNGAGGTTVTSTAHNMPDERLLNITGTTSYDGIFEIFNVLANTFDIDTAFVADDATGTWTSGAFPDDDIERWGVNDASNGELIYNGNEPFSGSYLATIAAAAVGGAAKRYKFRLLKNGANGFSIPNDVNATVTETTFLKGITAVKGDLFKLQVANFDGTQNIIIDTVSAQVQ